MRHVTRKLRSLSAVAMGAAALMLAVAPLGAVGATISVDTTPIQPGGSAVVVVVFDSTGTSTQTFSVTVTPQTGAVGALVFSDPQSSTTSAGGGGFSCFVNGTDSSLLECLYNNPSKVNGDTATVEVTVSAPADALGPFLITAIDDTTEPVELDTADIEVVAPVIPDVPVETPAELTPAFTG